MGVEVVANKEVQAGCCVRAATLGYCYVASFVCVSALWVIILLCATPAAAHTHR